MVHDFTAQLRALGDDRSEEAVDAAALLYAPLHEREPYAGVRVERAIAYGDHPRQRLDVLSPAQPAGDAAALLFVHGGGHTAGDRRLARPAYYDNVALWAVRNGLVGATMSYRLAPEHVWPSGADDVGAALRRLRTYVGERGGEPRRIFLMGHSAGATLIASYLARSCDTELAGAILCSGTYDVALMERSPNHVAYFGADPARYDAMSSVDALAESTLPLLVTYTQLEPRKFVLQADNLLHALTARRPRPVTSLCLHDHTHFSQVFQLNARDVDDFFTPVLRSFIAATAREQHPTAQDRQSTRGRQPRG
jgi:triacylglycerol lipase